MNAVENIAPYTKPFAPFYAAAVAARNWAYDRKVFKSGSVDVPVISVGNITAGGNGKTPVTEYLVRYFLCRKITTGVLSRGYRRSTTGTMVVSDGKTISGSPETAGDEPFQIAWKFRDAVVMVDEDRLRGALEMCKTFHPGVIILDDGFQHRRLERDLDIVLLDGQELFGGLHYLPAGRLRESLKSLRRADVVILVNCADAVSDVVNVVRGYTDGACFHGDVEAVNLTHLNTGEQLNVRDAPRKDCLAFCAIAKPKNFLSTLQASGLVVKDFLSFIDHHSFTSGDYDRLGKNFRTSGAPMVITTEKDAVRLDLGKLFRVVPPDVCYFLEIRFVLRQDESEFHSLLNQTVGAAA